MEYKAIIERYKEGFDWALQESIEDGWTPHGDLQIALAEVDGLDYTFFGLLMSRETEITGDS